MTEFKHVTVLLNEAVAGLNIRPDGTYVDATLGGGGHSSAILNQLTTGRLYSFDQDQTAIRYNQQHLKKFIDDGRSILIEDNFRNLGTALAKNGVKSVDGIVYDLGVSSPQFDFLTQSGNSPAIVFDIKNKNIKNNFLFILF